VLLIYYQETNLYWRAIKMFYNLHKNIIVIINVTINIHLFIETIYTHI